MSGQKGRPRRYTQTAGLSVRLERADRDFLDDLERQTGRDKAALVAEAIGLLRKAWIELAKRPTRAMNPMTPALGSVKLASSVAPLPRSAPEKPADEPIRGETVDLVVLDELAKPETAEIVTFEGTHVADVPVEPIKVNVHDDDPPRCTHLNVRKLPYGTFCADCKARLR